MARSITSSTVLNFWMTWTGPKISSLQIVMSSVTSLNSKIQLKGLYRHNFKWLSVYRVECLINNSIPQSVVCSVYNVKNWFFSILVSLQKWLAHFCCRKQWRNFYDLILFTLEKLSSTLSYYIIKVPRVSLWVGYGSLAIEGHLIILQFL